MNDEIKVLAVGDTRMSLINDEDYKNLSKVRKFLTTLPEYGEESQIGQELYEMADRIDNVYWLHTAYRKKYETNKNYSLKFQKIINECDGFVSFKEYIGISFRISKETHTSWLEDIDIDSEYKKILESISTKLDKNVKKDIEKIVYDGIEGKSFREFVPYFLYHEYDEQKIIKFLKENTSWNPLFVRLGRAARPSKRRCMASSTTRMSSIFILLL